MRDSGTSMRAIARGFGVRGLSLLVILAFAQSNCPGQGLTPEQAVARMTVAPGFSVQLIASEPLVRQPVCIEFDDRGRLWVIQYLQYPNPAELKRVRVDRYSRTEYERVPKPPPHGPRGADRITILEDTDGDGQMDAGHDFVNGLNLASGIAFGHGGVFVLNVPYLLFYPDRDRDDVPDSDPEVLLTGFGMQDAHSVANSLTWGPDGWLYGCQGSTVTANIRGIEFQQGVWRYHPVTRKFELFCEGGGNAWGLDFDRAGNLFYSTNYGGYVLVHGVPGGYYVKSFAKHGALHNRHAYGYFGHAAHDDFRGGHVTVGGLVYQGNLFPDSFRGKYIAADLLGHAVHVHQLHPDGSTFRTSYHSELLQANDPWFAPTDVMTGPDGSIYVADWHDARTAHPDPDAQWDRSNGRIYRIAPEGHDPKTPVDFSKLETDKLLSSHGDENQWFVRRARQELVRRQDPAAVETLREWSIDPQEEVPAIEALWSLHAVGGFDETVASRLFDAPNPAVRFWTVRLVGDARSISDQLAKRLDELAERESDVRVRQQIACVAARLPPRQALPIINTNILRDEDNEDPFLPLLWWWAVERHSTAAGSSPDASKTGAPTEVSGREEVLRRFTRPSTWRSQLARDFLLPRLIRRYIAEGTRAGTDSVVRMLEAAPGESAREAFWQPIGLGLSDRGPNKVASSVDKNLYEHVLARWRIRPGDLDLLQTAIRLGCQQAIDLALQESLDEDVSTSRRVVLLQALSPAADRFSSEPLIRLFRNDTSLAVQTAALDILARLDDASIAEPLIAVHQSNSPEPLKRKIRDVLLARTHLAQQWLEAVDRGEVEAADTPLEQIRRVAWLSDPQLDRLVLKHWGKLDGATREESLAEVRRLNNDLRAARGDPHRGRQVFLDRCSSCHRLFGDGTRVGPDLTTANRKDRQALLVSLVAPSSVIRKEFVSVIVETVDGRVITGIPVQEHSTARVNQRDSTSNLLMLIDGKGMKHTIPNGDVAHIRDSEVSLMPADLYLLISPQQLRDLFSYLQRDVPLKVESTTGRPSTLPQ